jgi:predicted DNA-binding transcriptional regulator AlpA
VSGRWIRYRCQEGMPRVRWGSRMVRFDPVEVERWLKERYEEAG